MEEICHAIQAVYEGLLAIQSFYEKDFTIYKKEGGSPVTDADYASHRAIESLIQNYYPKDRFVSEEGDFLKKEEENKRSWILDPLDGTKTFIAKVPEFAISLGMVEDGNPILGVVSNPVTRECFWSYKGYGSGYGIFPNGFLENKKDNLTKIQDFLNQTKNQKITKHPLLNQVDKEGTSKKLVLVSRTEYQDGILNPILEIQEFQNKYIVLPIGSIAYKLGLLGAGLGDCILSLRPKNSWDVCGGIAYIEAIGMEHLFIREERKIQYGSHEPSGCGFLAGEKESILEIWKSFQTLLKSNLCCS